MSTSANSRLEALEERAARLPMQLDLARLDDEERRRLDELTDRVPGWEEGSPDFTGATTDELMELERILIAARVF